MLQAEWIKFRSVRSTIWTLGAMAVMALGVAVIAGLTIPGGWNTSSPMYKLTFDPTSISLRGLLFSQMVIGVLGALVITAEYGTGTIRATLAGIPNRPLVLAAKAAVLATVAFVVGEVLSFGAFFLGQTLLTSPAPHATLSQPGVLRAVVGGGLIIPVLGLFALGLGAIIRYTAGAISAFVGILLVLPIVVEALPSAISGPVDKFLPFQISSIMMSTRPTVGTRADAFSPWVGFAVLCAYSVIALAIGGWLMLRRDA